MKRELVFVNHEDAKKTWLDSKKKNVTSEFLQNALGNEVKEIMPFFSGINEPIFCNDAFFFDTNNYESRVEVFLTENFNVCCVEKFEGKENVWAVRYEY